MHIKFSSGNLKKRRPWWRWEDSFGDCCIASPKARREQDLEKVKFVKKVLEQ
jgi:hypothetical protein